MGLVFECLKKALRAYSWSKISTPTAGDKAEVQWWTINSRKSSLDRRRLMKIYHITPAQNVDAILQDGFNGKTSEGCGDAVLA
jgi:hypothetical protein